MENDKDSKRGSSLSCLSNFRHGIFWLFLVFFDPPSIILFFCDMYSTKIRICWNLSKFCYFFCNIQISRKFPLISSFYLNPLTFQRISELPDFLQTGYRREKNDPIILELADSINYSKDIPLVATLKCVSYSPARLLLDPEPHDFLIASRGVKTTTLRKCNLRAFLFASITSFTNRMCLIFF